MFVAPSFSLFLLLPSSPALSDNEIVSSSFSSLSLSLAPGCNKKERQRKMSDNNFARVVEATLLIFPLAAAAAAAADDDDDD